MSKTKWREMAPLENFRIKNINSHRDMYQICQWQRQGALLRTLELRISTVIEICRCRRQGEETRCPLKNFRIKNFNSHRDMSMSTTRWREMASLKNFRIKNFNSHRDVHQRCWWRRQGAPLAQSIPSLKYIISKSFKFDNFWASLMDGWIDSHFGSWVLQPSL